MRSLSFILALAISVLQAQEETPLPPKKAPGLGGVLDGSSGDTPRPQSYEIDIGDNTSTELSSDNRGNLTIVINGRIQLRADNGLQVFANRAVVNQSTRKIILSGNVSIYQNGLVYRGHSTTYYIDEKRADTSKLRVGIDPILMEAGNLQTVPYKNGNAYVGDNIGITTHDAQDPDFWLRARKTTIIPGERIIFRDLKVVAGDTPIFWLPYLSQPFDQKLGYHFVPGGRSNLGFFLKNRYGVMLGGTEDPVTGLKKDSWLLSQFQADLYSLRGLGLGADLSDTRIDEANDFGWLKLYYIHDFNSDLKRAGIDRGSITSDRFRIDFTHRVDLFKREAADYSFEANLTKLSDPFFLEDFDPKMARIDSDPDNFLALTRRTANSITSLGTRIQTNRFYQTDTRLPELNHDWVRQPFFGSSVLYESQSSLGIYDEHLSDFREDSLKDEAAMLLPGDPRLSQINLLLGDRGYSRFHTYHEFSRPFKAGFLNIIPRAGAGYTYYGSMQGPSDSVTRTHLSTGLDVSFKMSRSYPEWVDQKWGLDGALHVIEPYASLNWLATDELDGSFTRIERLTPTTRPRTHRVGRFTARDELEDWQ
ncbi:LPS assembly protein LptD, partial [Akkermansiaceae bacterium]|nr:LPS assembly protein LptD [Akkermansiaceae bacterium]